MRGHKSDARPPVIALMGPTASGKTALALALAERLPCDLISVDSVQVYRGLDIGSAKPGPETLKRFPHRLIDLRDPHEIYSAAEFHRDALEAIRASHRANRIPLLVGGTMLYFRVLFEGIDDLPEGDPVIRARIDRQYELDGVQAMHDLLRRVDAKAASRIHPHNRQRVQRALEVWMATGKPMSSLQGQTSRPRLPWNLCQIALSPEKRSVLHERIVMRFERMLKAGLVEELATLRNRYPLHSGLPSMRAVGYRQVWQFLEGHQAYQDMVKSAIMASRQFAKRQLTWLRGWEDLHWVLTTDERVCDVADAQCVASEAFLQNPLDRALKILDRATK